MNTLLGLGALVVGAAFLTAKKYDESPGGRDDLYYRSRSILMVSSVTKSADAIRNLDARDNAQMYLQGLSVQLASSLNDECMSLMSSQNNDKHINTSVNVILRKINALVKSIEKLRNLSENELINIVLSHPRRVGDSPLGVSGVKGTEKWLLGGMKAEIHNQKELDAHISTKIGACISGGNSVAQKAKNEVLYKILERIPSPHFATRFPFEAALLAIEHLDDTLVVKSSTTPSDAMMRDSNDVPTTISEMHNYVVNVARKIKAQ